MAQPEVRATRAVALHPAVACVTRRVRDRRVVASCGRFLADATNNTAYYDGFHLAGDHALECPACR
eukprot:7652676-Pyramimonas_sp.AAC.1